METLHAHSTAPDDEQWVAGVSGAELCQLDVWFETDVIQVQAGSAPSSTQIGPGQVRFKVSFEECESLQERVDCDSPAETLWWRTPAFHGPASGHFLDQLEFPICVFLYK